MAQRTLRFASGASVHARPAALFSQAAAGSGVPVRIPKGDSSPGDVASVLQVVVSGQRRQVSFFADGPQADDAAVAGPERPTTSTGRTPAVLLDVDQLLISACRALQMQCSNSLLVSRQESSSMMIPVGFWFTISGTFVEHHVLRAAAQTGRNATCGPCPPPSHGHLFHDAEVVLFGPHRPGQHGEFRSRAAAFGRQVGSLSDDPCACRTARTF
jgi:phosphocarrier protein HPr